MAAQQPAPTFLQVLPLTMSPNFPITLPLGAQDLLNVGCSQGAQTFMLSSTTTPTPSQASQPSPLETTVTNPTCGPTSPATSTSSRITDKSEPVTGCSTEQSGSTTPQSTAPSFALRRRETHTNAKKLGRRPSIKVSKSDQEPVVPLNTSAIQAAQAREEETQAPASAPVRSTNTHFTDQRIGDPNINIDQQQKQPQQQQQQTEHQQPQQTYISYIPIQIMVPVQTTQPLTPQVGTITSPTTASTASTTSPLPISTISAGMGPLTMPTPTTAGGLLEHVMDAFPAFCHSPAVIHPSIVPRSAPAVPHPLSPALFPENVTDFDHNMFMHRQQKLVEQICKYLNDPQQNPRKGSVLSEKIQKAIKKQWPSLYTHVVDSEYSGQWHKFIKAHTDVFELLVYEDKGSPRVRLLEHQNYEMADREESDERQARQRLVCEVLKQYLHSHEDDIRVEDFIAHWASLVGHRYPPQNAQVRYREIQQVVKQYPEEFSLDEDKGVRYARIRTAQTWAPPTKKGEPICSLKRTQSERQDLGANLAEARKCAIPPKTAPAMHNQQADLQTFQLSCSGSSPASPAAAASSAATTVASIDIDPALAALFPSDVDFGKSKQPPTLGPTNPYTPFKSANSGGGPASPDSLYLDSTGKLDIPETKKEFDMSTKATSGSSNSSTTATSTGATLNTSATAQTNPHGLMDATAKLSQQLCQMSPPTQQTIPTPSQQAFNVNGLLTGVLQQSPTSFGTTIGSSATPFAFPSTPGGYPLQWGATPTPLALWANTPQVQNSPLPQLPQTKDPNTPAGLMAAALMPQGGGLLNAMPIGAGGVSPTLDPDNDDYLLPVREQKLTRYIVDFLHSPQHNPHHGSMASERVQNCIKTAHPDLYKSVVGVGYSNQWHRFIQAHPGSLNLFTVDESNRTIYRIRLDEHTNWQQADKRERIEKAQRETRLLEALRDFLREQGKPCTVDEFMSAYPAVYAKELLGRSLPPLPPRGDFVRCIKRNPNIFSFDSRQFAISLVSGNAVIAEAEKDRSKESKKAKNTGKKKGGKRNPN